MNIDANKIKKKKKELVRLRKLMMESGQVAAGNCSKPPPLSPQSHSVWTPGQQLVLMGTEPLLIRGELRTLLIKLATQPHCVDSCSLILNYESAAYPGIRCFLSMGGGTIFAAF